MQHDQKFADISQYVNWLINQYHAIHPTKEQQAIYRLINVRYTLTGKCKLKVQAVDSDIYFEIAPHTLVQNDIMITCFSPLDVRMITYFAYEEANKPKFMIRFKKFCSRLNQTIFSLQERGEENLLKKTAQEISANKELISNMSPEDSHLIGYITGIEQKAMAKCSDIKEFANLSKREAECLIFLLKGKTAKEIAMILNLSPKSVESYLDNVKVKSKCYTRAQLFDKAFTHGLIDVISL